MAVYLITSLADEAHNNFNRVSRTNGRWTDWGVVFNPPVLYSRTMIQGQFRFNQYENCEISWDRNSPFKRELARWHVAVQSVVKSSGADVRVQFLDCPKWD